MNKTKPKKLTREQLERKIKVLESRISKAYDWAGNAMNSTGDDVFWCVDELVKVLSAGQYKNVVKAQKAGENGPDTYDWRTVQGRD